MTLKLEKCSGDWDGCQWKCMLFNAVVTWGVAESGIDSQNTNGTQFLG